MGKIDIKNMDLYYGDFHALRDAAIWDEVKDRLKESALGMSGGQQQRLCVARALAVEPEVLLMDGNYSTLKVCA